MKFETGVLVREAGGSIPCLKAISSQARREGMNAKEPQQSNISLLLPLTPLIHMKVEEPLDLVFLSRKGRVKKIIPNVPPSLRMYGHWAWSCLEMKAGGAEKENLKEKEILIYQAL